MQKLLLLGFGRVGRILAGFAAKDFSVTAFDSRPIAGNIPALKKTSLDELTPADLAPFDWVMNCLPVRFNRQVLSLVVETGGNYADLATDSIETPEHLAYQQQFVNRLLLANIGIAPGLSNLLVAQLVARGARELNLYFIEHLFFEESDSPKEMTTGDENGGTTPQALRPTGFFLRKAAPSWCVEDAVATLYDQPVSSVKGQLIRHNNFSDSERVSTSQGEFVTFRFFGEEILSLARTFGDISLNLKAGGGEIEIARQMFLTGAEPEIGATDQEPDGIFGIKIAADVGEVEIFLKPGHQLWREGLPGNHISFHTADVAYSMIKAAAKQGLQGLYFPEMLPKTVRDEILQQASSQAYVWCV